MVKKIFLVRHAKTEESTLDRKDFNRELTNRGMQDATKLGNYFLKKGIKLDQILSSDAARARTTAELIASQMNYELTRIYLNHEIYEASVRTLLKLVNDLKDEWKTVMIVGHNPVINYLAEFITGTEIGYMNTGSSVSISINTDSWSKINQNSGKLNFLVVAKNLKN